MKTLMAYLYVEGISAADCIFIICILFIISPFKYADIIIKSIKIGFRNCNLILPSDCVLLYLFQYETILYAIDELI